MAGSSEEAYLKEAMVSELFEEMRGALLKERPQNPSTFLHSWLEKKESPFEGSAIFEPAPAPMRRLGSFLTAIHSHNQSLVRRCLLIGCGAVGMACAYSIIIEGIFDELIMNDMNKEKTEGEVMDLQHGIPFTKGIKVKAGSIAEGAGSDVVIITAGVAQKPGETRIALIQRNVAIFQKMIPEVVRHCPDALLLIVSNPVDILTYITWKISGFPPERVIGSGTVLDSARFQHYLAAKFHLAPHSINAHIVGEHGDTEVAAWSKVNVAGQSVYDPHDPDFEQIYTSTKRAAYEIIQRKGSTSYAIGLAVAYICKAILSNSSRILTVSRYHPKYDCALSMPTIVNASGAQELFEVQLTPEEDEKLEASARTLRTVLSEAGF